MSWKILVFLPFAQIFAKYNIQKHTLIVIYGGSKNCMDFEEYPANCYKSHSILFCNDNLW